MEQIFYMPMLGIIITIACYAAGFLARKFVPAFLALPMIVASILIIMIVLFTPLSLEQYMTGGNVVMMFMGPVTIILALKIYRQREELKANIIPILGGCIAGSGTSLLSVYFFSRLFGLDDLILVSILPKSVTSAIAMELSENSGGLADLTVSMVVLTGIVSAAFAPVFIKIFKLKDPIATGIAMGASGHALGTATAIQLGETQAAMSGLSIPVMGIITSIFWVFVF